MRSLSEPTHPHPHALNENLLDAAGKVEISYARAEQEVWAGAAGRRGWWGKKGKSGSE